MPAAHRAVQATYGNELTAAALSGRGPLARMLRSTLAYQAVGLSSALPWASNREMLAHMNAELDEASAATDMGRSAGTALPAIVRAQMEAAFGHDFGHVRVHNDLAANRAAAALNAHAFAVGADLFFGEGELLPGTEVGDRLLAHELTHVVQHDEGRLNAAHGVSSPTDATEREAYANESTIMATIHAGMATIHPGPLPSIDLLEWDDSAWFGPEATGDEHAEVGANDATSLDVSAVVSRQAVGSEANAAGSPTQARPRGPDGLFVSAAVQDASLMVAVPGNVDPDYRPGIFLAAILHDFANPFEDPGGRAPTEAELFRRLPDQARPPRGFSRYVGQQGTVAEPFVRYEAASGSLAGASGRPEASDVRQGQTSDCGFLSLVAEMALRDQRALQTMLRPTTLGADVTLHHFAGHDARGRERWVPRVYSVERRFAGGRSAVPGLQSGPTLRVRWAARRTPSNLGPLLRVVRLEQREQAIWVTMIERALALYAQEHGTSGRGFRTGQREDGLPRNGYEILNTGSLPGDALRVLYGNDVDITTESHRDRGANPAVANLASLRLLLRERELREAGHPALLLADADSQCAPRTVELGRRLLPVARQRGWTVLAAEIRALNEALSRVRALNPIDATTPAWAAIRAHAAALVLDPWLTGLTAPEWTRYRDQATMLANSGTATPPGTPLTLFPLHMYSVLGSELLDSAGRQLVISSRTLTAETAARIDLDRSVVYVRNPHHTNEPHSPFQGAPDGEDDGNFTLSLRRYLDMVDFVELGVPRER